MDNTIIDALGNPVIVGNWYGYSRNDGGHSHTTMGKVSYVTESDGQYRPPKVRLIECRVNRFHYGKPTDRRKDEIPADISIAAFMVFPVPAPT